MWKKLLKKALVGNTIAEVPWDIDPDRDKFVEGFGVPGNHRGVLRLQEGTAISKAAFSSSAFYAFYEGNREYPLEAREDYREIPEFKPFLPQKSEQS